VAEFQWHLAAFGAFRFWLLGELAKVCVKRKSFALEQIVVHRYSAGTGLLILVVSSGLVGGADTAAYAEGRVGFRDWEIEAQAAILITPAAERAIQRGLEYLALQQHPDGSFGSGAYRGNVAIVGLAGMAFLASGSTPGRGPYGRQISRAIDYLLANTDQSGFICYAPAASHGPMYGHGFATLFLAECYGMDPRPELGTVLRKAVRLIIETQNDEGGWRYQPQRADADISVTVCEIMALRAARNAGIFVPKETVDRCVEYLRRCQNPDGGFAYQPQVGESAFARSAAGLVGLFCAGIYEGPEVERAAQYLMRFLPQPGQPIPDPPYYEYGHYYAVQAMWILGGSYWQRWYPAVRDDLVARQRDGYWRSPLSNEYATAMALLVLQLPNNMLPIFQR